MLRHLYTPLIHALQMRKTAPRLRNSCLVIQVKRTQIALKCNTLLGLFVIRNYDIFEKSRELILTKVACLRQDTIYSHHFPSFDVLETLVIKVRSLLLKAEE
jgi:hypothetical protein